MFPIMVKRDYLTFGACMNPVKINNQTVTTSVLKDWNPCLMPKVFLLEFVPNHSIQLSFVSEHV